MPSKTLKPRRMIVGILLAAGSAMRFGGNKLLAELGDGRCIAEVSCAKLRPAVDRLIAVVRPDAIELSARLAAAGAEICVFADAKNGMGASIAHGVMQARHAAAWLIALADMPLVAGDDVLSVAEALRAGAGIALPVASGKRGHPVGLSRQFFAELAALSGDTGAREILARFTTEIVEVPVGDVRSLHDVDTEFDLKVARQLFIGLSTSSPVKTPSTST